MVNIGGITLLFALLGVVELWRSGIMSHRLPRQAGRQILLERAAIWGRKMPEVLERNGCKLLEKPLIKGNRAACVYQLPNGQWKAIAVAMDIYCRPIPEDEAIGPTPEAVHNAHQNHKVWVYEFDPNT